MRRRLCAALLAALPGLACGTLNTARPLEPGQHAVAATLGGPMVELFDLPLLLPNSCVEGRSGLTHLAGRPLDLNYGVHLTSLLFGVPGVHGGGSYLLLRQTGGIPALALGGRLYLFSNVVDLRKPLELRGAWTVTQVELTASYQLFDQLLYGGLVEYLDLGLPGLLLAPFAGVELHPGLDWLGLQLEARYLVPWQSNVPAAPQWIAPADQGAVLVSAGLVLRIDLLARPGGAS